MHEQRRRWPSAAAVVLALFVAVTGCSSGDADEVDVGPTAPRAREDAETLTTDIAPSQVTGSTVVRPDTPPPCEPAAVTIWTASVDIVADTATAILRVRNDGAVRCELDVRESPRIDPRTEPDLWLEPGEWGELWIGPDERSTCDEPRVVLLAEIAVLDQVRSVPTAAVVPCDWAIVALFGADAPAGPCNGAALAAVRARDELVVRNTSFMPCRLGDLVDVDQVGTDVRIAPPPVAVGALAAGDTIRFPVTPGTAGCEPVEGRARFAAGAEVVAPGLRSCDTVAVGPGEPFYDGPRGPLADLPERLGDIELVAALAALEPFVAP